MKLIVLSLLIITKAYSFCAAKEAQIVGSVISVLETKTSCHYEVKVSENNKHTLCPLSSKEIEATLVVDRKVAGLCEYSVGQTFSRILVLDKKTNMIIID